MSADQSEKFKVIAMSNGHHWIKAFGLVACLDCGVVRRGDDNNKPCRGVVRVALRTEPPSEGGRQ